MFARWNVCNSVSFTRTQEQHSISSQYYDFRCGVCFCIALSIHTLLHCNTNGRIEWWNVRYFFVHSQASIDTRNSHGVWKWNDSRSILHLWEPHSCNWTSVTNVGNVTPNSKSKKTVKDKERLSNECNMTAKPDFVPNTLHWHFNWWQINCETATFDISSRFAANFSLKSAEKI